MFHITLVILSHMKVYQTLVEIADYWCIFLTQFQKWIIQLNLFFLMPSKYHLRELFLLFTIILHFMDFFVVKAVPVFKDHYFVIIIINFARILKIILQRKVGIIIWLCCQIFTYQIWTIIATHIFILNKIIWRYAIIIIQQSVYSIFWGNFLRILIIFILKGRIWDKFLFDGKADGCLGVILRIVIFF